MKVLAIILVMAAIPVAVAFYFPVKRKLVRKRRSRLRSRPLPDGVEEVLARNIGLYALLPDDLREELHGHINVFLNEKRFLGLGGQEITAEVMATVAGIACLLLLNRDSSYFPGFTSILIYPETYETTQVEHDGVVETSNRSRRAGESWHRGPIVLSWSDVLHGAANPGDGYNVVLHEFAHKLDAENSGTNGLPILQETAHYAEWAEFFAVATESFFEKGAAMSKRLPDLYEQLQRFYAVDPAKWHKRLT